MVPCANSSYGEVVEITSPSPASHNAFSFGLDRMSKKKVIERLYVTMKRSFAGNPHTMVDTMKSLGLRHRHQTVERPNTAEVRGALAKVKHLVIVETEAMYATRKKQEAIKNALRPPIIIKHSKLPLGGNYAPLNEQKL